MAGRVNARGIALPLLLLAVVIGTQSSALEVLPGDPGYVDPLALFEPVTRKTGPRNDRVCDSDDHLCHPKSGPVHVPEQEKKCPQYIGKDAPAKDFHLSRLVAHVLEEFDRIGFEFGRFHLEGRLSEYSVDLLKKYRRGENKNSHEVYEIMVKLLSVKVRHEAGDIGWSASDELPFVGIANRPWYQDVLFCCLGCATLTFLAFAAVRITMSVHSNFWRTVKWSVLVLFFISVPWEWYRLYSEAQSVHLAEMMKGIPEACRPNTELSMWTNVGMFMQSAFIAAEDPCLKYQKALFVNPLAEVTPLQAIAVAFTRLFTDPLVYVFSALGKCTKALLVELPVVSHVFVAILVPIFLLFLMVLLVLTSQQYAIRVPFILSIAPSPSNITPAIAPQRDAAEAEQLKMLREEIPEIRKLLESHSHHQQDVMQRIEAGTLGGGRLRITHSDTGDAALRRPDVAATAAGRSRSEQLQRTSVAEPAHRAVANLGPGVEPSAPGDGQRSGGGRSERDGAGGRPRCRGDAPSPAGPAQSDQRTRAAVDKPPCTAEMPSAADMDDSPSAKILSAALASGRGEPPEQQPNPCAEAGPSVRGTISEPAGHGGVDGSPESGRVAHDKGTADSERGQGQRSENGGAASTSIPDAGNVEDIGSQSSIQ